MAGRRRRQSEDPPQAGAPAWMMTYGDLVTQLLAFFVLLLTMSNVNADKFEQAVRSLHSAIGIGGSPSNSMIDGGGSPGLIILPPVGEEPEPNWDTQLEEVRGQVAAAAAAGDFADLFEFGIEERGLVLRFEDTALFDIGKADLKPEAMASLYSLLEILTKIPNPIRVEGHTDDWPIASGAFPSNWELSGARASSVVRLFQDEGLAAERLSVAGYGEYRPVASNESAEGRARNRRVDIVVLSLKFSEQEPK